ncbi:MAG: LysR family transcriptional regulator [Terrimesophilobacter sp.]
MDVRRLELLRELAERGSITAVAHATSRTASAVSQQLKLLERESGTPLTERSGRGVVLTVAGRMLAQTATDVAVALERASAVWTEFTQAPSGEVTLATFPTGGQMFLPGLLTAVAAVPGLTLVCSDRDPDMLEFADLTSDFDVVLAYTLEGPRSWSKRILTAVPLMTEPLDIALSPHHRLAGKATLSAADVVDEEWIGVPVGFPFDRVMLEIESLTGRPANVIQRFSDTRVTEALVASGHGIALVPRYTAHGVGENVLELRPLVGVRAVRDIVALVRPDRAERPSVRAVLAALRTEATLIAQRHTVSAPADRRQAGSTSRANSSMSSR